MRFLAMRGGKEAGITQFRFIETDELPILIGQPEVTLPDEVESVPLTESVLLPLDSDNPRSEETIPAHPEVVVHARWLVIMPLVLVVLIGSGMTFLFLRDPVFRGIVIGVLMMSGSLVVWVVMHRMG